VHQLRKETNTTLLDDLAIGEDISNEERDDTTEDMDKWTPNSFSRFTLYLLMHFIMFSKLLFCRTTQGRATEMLASSAITKTSIFAAYI
jgi:hypothetical protein